jgi:alpha-glucoside transport system substrate-binding protein
LTLVAAACADDDDGDAQTDEGSEDTQPQDGGGAPDLEGEEVTVFGPEVEVEMQSLEESFAPFEEETGVDVVVTGDRSFETQVGSQIQAGNPPDIAMFPQPGRVQEYAEDIPALSEDVLAEIEENFEPGWTDPVTVDGEIKAVPAKADLKSLVWYNPQIFQDNDYEVPETLEDFEALAEQMAEDGNTPFCVGSGSDDATGWPMTDWIEDYMLRLQGPDVYDQWAAHEIPFDDPQVVEVGQHVYDFLAQDGFVLGGLENVTATPFAEAGLPVADGDCMMYHLGNFYAANFTDADAELGPDGDVSAFFLPGSEENPNITLSGGIYATPFSDDEAVMATMEYIASTEFADARAGNEIAGFLSPNRNVDTSLYPNELSQQFGDILAEASPVRFDASDLMPSAVGSGTFWTAMNNITNGDQNVEQAFAEVESSWPTDG